MSYPSATASDAVTASPSFFYSKERGSTFLPGSNRVTVMATDESGNASTCHFYVTVRDAVAPSITCPAPVVAEATGSSSAPVHYGPAFNSDVVALSPLLAQATSTSGAWVTYPSGTLVTPSDGISSATVSYSPPSGSAFPMGATPVTVTATDGSGSRWAPPRSTSWPGMRRATPPAAPSRSWCGLRPMDEAPFAGDS